MKLYIIAGEASGDLHGSNLIRALRAQRPDIQCLAWGGDLMLAAGATLRKHYRDLAFMGFWEVAKNLRTIFRNLDFCKKDILGFQPDAVVFIDYPGFNLRMAKWARRQGFHTIYYISPQIWAWHQSRVHDIRRDIDQMLVILPFEKAFYEKFGVRAEFVGHPLLDAVSNFKKNFSGGEISQNWQGAIALLPGSRKQEVSRILPAMLSVVEKFPGERFVVAGSTALPADFYKRHFLGKENVEFVQGKTYEVLAGAKAALVKSGTSTLETALFGVPQVVCYAGNPISFFIAKRLVDVKFISLVNLILDKPLVRELIQNELNFNNLEVSLREILSPEKSAQIRDGYAELQEMLGDGGASARAAEAIIGRLTQERPR